MITRFKHTVVGISVLVIALFLADYSFNHFFRTGPQHKHTITLRVDWHIATPSDVWYLINKTSHQVPEAEWSSLNGTVKRDFDWDETTLYGIGVRMGHPDPEPYWFSCDIEVDGHPFANPHAHARLDNKPGDLFCSTV